MVNMEIKINQNNKRIELDESLISAGAVSPMLPPRISKQASTISLREIVQNDPDCRDEIEKRVKEELEAKDMQIE